MAHWTEVARRRHEGIRPLGALMIVVASLTIEIGERVLVEDGSFLVAPGERVGLVGRNGVGKSSLASVITGEHSAPLKVRGEARATGSVGWLTQAPRPGGLGLDPSGFAHVLSARGLDVVDHELAEARSQMAKDPTTEAIACYSELEERFGRQGGYEAESTLARLADGLGLRQELLLEDVDRLSGGQRRRLDLMRLLYQAPDVLILDEPTNHLDLPAKRWLMGELARYPGALLIISHDLHLLDESITKIVNLADQALHEYKGNYASFRVQHAAEQVRSHRAAALEQREIVRLRTLADGMRGGSVRRARTAKAIDTRVARLESNRTRVGRRERTTRFSLPEPRRSGVDVLAVRHLAVRYGELAVLDDVEFSLQRGERLVIGGRNGAGKSSLLRCLAGVQRPSSGAVDFGINVSVGYFAQEHEQIDPRRTALDQIDDRILATESARRALLGSFGLPAKAANRLPATLSGGERAKLGLAMLAAGQANLLLLDEPTNNLDPASTEAVGQMLRAWPGTIIAVSHNPAFVAALEPTRALLLPDERAELWRDEYLDLVELR